MNKTDRLLAIVLELQRKGKLRAEDLAGIFETSVRTIYRDMQALSEAGVPLVGAPGQGYSLMEGYFLPPISFTAEEAVALLIGIDFVEKQFDAGYKTSASTGRGKIEAVLPEPVRRESEQQRAGVRLIAHRTTMRSDYNADTFAMLRRAIREQRVLSMNYLKGGVAELASADSPAPAADSGESREVDPYGLVFVRGEWMLIAYCHLREELRHFRLSRIQSLQLLTDTFELPQDFNLHSYVAEDNRNVIVRLMMNRELAVKVREQHYYYVEKVEEHSQELLVTLRVREPEDVLQWVLSWGSGAVVLEPEILRMRVREEAEKLLKRY